MSPMLIIQCLRAKYSNMSPGRVSLGGSLRARSNRGALLVEALIAIAVMTIALTVMVQSLAAHVRANVFCEEYLKAELLVDNVAFPSR